MARHGVPEMLHTDNMPFGSAEFKQFAADWDIQLSTSSPTYAQSNGQAERAVQTVKKLLTKAQMSGQDPYTALLQYRLSPVSGLPFSPAQMLMGRQIRGRLPTLAKVLKPATVDARPHLLQQQQNYKQQYDKGAKPLPPLHTGDSVRVKRKGKWEPAVVVAVDDAPRSYIVNCQGSTLRRNRRDLLSTPGVPPPHVSDSFLDDYGVTPDVPDAAPDIPKDADLDERPDLLDDSTDAASDEAAAAQPQVDNATASRPQRPHCMPEKFSDFVIGKY